MSGTRHSTHGRKMKAMVWMKGLSKSYLLLLAGYKASKKIINQLSRRILVGHELSDAC